MVRHLCTIKTRLRIWLAQPRRVQYPCIEFRSRRSGLVIMWYCFKNPYHDNRYVHAERKTKTHRKKNTSFCICVVSGRENQSIAAAYGRCFIILITILVKLFDQFDSYPFVYCYLCVCSLLNPMEN